MKLYLKFTEQQEKKIFWYIWYITKIGDKKKRNEKKAFKRSFSKFFMDKDKRIYQKSYIIDCFSNSKKWNKFHNNYKKRKNLLFKIKGSKTQGCC